jgi:DNA mismatch repair protein MutS
MAQWFLLKAEQPDALLFFRMGDFFELFFEDAQAAAAALDIALTARGEHAGAPVPMCGVPVGTSEIYLARLIRRGFRVAVAEQMEAASERSGRGPLRRAIVRLVTPGTLTEDALLEAARPSLLLALVSGAIDGDGPGTRSGAGPGRAAGAAGFGAAWLDVSTGLFETQAVAPDGLPGLLGRVEPSEILAPPGVALGEWEARRAPTREPSPPSAARTRLAEAFGARSLDAFGSFSDAEAVAAVLALDYVRATQAGRLPRLSPPVPLGEARHLALDAATRASLDILRARDGDGPSLFSAVSRTLTAPGARLLAQRLAAPLTDPGAIGRRQDGWCWLLEAPAALAALRAALRGVPDMARALGRLSLGRGTARDLAAVRDGLAAADAARAALAAAKSHGLPTGSVGAEGLGLPGGVPAGMLAAARQVLAGKRPARGSAARPHADGAPRPVTPEAGMTEADTTEADTGRLAALRMLLARALVEQPPVRDDGHAVAAGFDGKLDAERALRDDSRRVIATLQLDYAQRYGVASLRIRHHAQLGYVVEAPAVAVETLRAHPDLTLRQGMANGARFSSVELGELDRRITEAAERAGARERAVLARLVADVLAEGDAIAAAAAALAGLDVAQSAARLAEGGRWCRPVVSADVAFRVEAGRHPVVEAALAGLPSAAAGSARPVRARRAGAGAMERAGVGTADAGMTGAAGEEADDDASGPATSPAAGPADQPEATVFQPNDCDLSPERRVLLLTGPNMAGKSTFLRQNALIVILAQAGLPVPADRARIGVVDRLFSRVGAADDLARGRSTFMVEMTETAAILHQAGPRSLVVVDEIGRGTATLDGLAIAWAVLEALHERCCCRTVFATHFHELAQLGGGSGPVAVGGVAGGRLARMRPHTMRVQEWKDGVVFLHEVAEGAAGRSWGVHVARLAGVPAVVVRRAGLLLSRLEAGERPREDLPLFAGLDPPSAGAEQAGVGTAEEAPGPGHPPVGPDQDGATRDPAAQKRAMQDGATQEAATAAQVAAGAVLEALSRIDADALSPREALDALYHLKGLSRATS